MHDYALYIGRFQPFHHGHIAAIKHALSLAKNLILILGGYELASSVTDPWTVLERKKMILSCLSAQEKKRIHFIFIRDRLYNEDLWKENLVREVQFIAKPHSKIVIVGHMKDKTSYYLKIFPQWPLLETGNFYGLNSTQFRNQYFLNQQPSYEDIPKPIVPFLKKFRQKKLFKTLKGELQFLINQKFLPSQKNYLFLLWGHYVFLEKRNYFPGKALYSLPNLEMFPQSVELKNYFVERKAFYFEKYDGKNTQGKEVFFYRIPAIIPFNSHLKMLRGEYSFVLWDDFCLMENKIFADHYQIIKNLILF